MCVSPEVDFIASGIIGAVGIATFFHVKHPRAVLFAAMPLLFALHQFIEGFVWLGLEGRIGPIARDHAVYLFMLYAQGILPFLVPLAVLLMEQVRWRKLVIGAFAAVGLFLTIYATYSVSAFPNGCIIQEHSIAYSNPRTEYLWVAALYILTTCGSLITSGHRVIRWFGLLNLVGLSIVYVFKAYAFTSVWCLYAACVSVVLYFQFRQGHFEFLESLEHTVDKIREEQLKRFEKIKEKQLKRLGKLKIPF